MNGSPWLAQLKRQRPTSKLEQNEHADVVIVGGGIAGVTSAYYLLRHTQKKILLIEANQIAHGATGHNAGQVVSYFERPFEQLVNEFGSSMAAQGVDAIESAWMLLEEILHDAKLKTPLFSFTGYLGICNTEMLDSFIRSNALRVAAGLEPERLFVADEDALTARIPSNQRHTYSTIPRSSILSLLETTNQEYFAVVASRKGCLNSALFTEELAGYLLTAYPSRFQIAEQTPVKTIALHRTMNRLECGSHIVTAPKVVLCTNGFEQLSIQNGDHGELDTKFHLLVTGVVGYMTGYLEPHDLPPTALSYFSSTHKPDDAYFYVTRRPFEGEAQERHNLICTGGPEEELADRKKYHRAKFLPKDILQSITDFLQKTHIKTPPSPKYVYQWSGLMGYTPNRVRMIGTEPCNSNLLYNLGCNGIGILPSIYGGKRIADILSGKKMRASMFDPRDQRCR